MIHSDRPQPATRLRRGVRPRWAALVMLAILLLSACGPAATDEDDRRFANRTQPPLASPAIEGTPSAEVPDEIVPPVAATPDPAQLLSATTEADAAFFVIDEQLVIASVDGTLEEVALAGPVMDLSVSPAGTLAAVLVGPASDWATPDATPTELATPPSTAGSGDTAWSLVVIDLDGERIRSIDDLTAAFESQPDVVDALSAEGAVAAVAMGSTADDLVLAFPDGLLLRVPDDGAVTVVPGSGNLADAQQVVWSPDGGALAIVAADTPGGMPAVYYTAVRDDGVDPVRIAPAPGRTTGDVAWLPDGRGVVFVDATGPVGAETLRSGRDLFVTPLRTDRRTLVAAAGVIGPAAGVVDFAVNPDGLSVAYTLYRAEGGEVRFNSLWVGSVDGRTAVQVTLPDIDAVRGLAWTAAGLLVLTETVEGEAPSVLLVGPDGVATAPDGQVATPAP